MCINVAKFTISVWRFSPRCVVKFTILYSTNYKTVWKSTVWELLLYSDYSEELLKSSHYSPMLNWQIIHGENFMVFFITLSMVVWFPTGTLGILATLVYVFTMRVVIYDILSMAIIPTLPYCFVICDIYYCEFYQAVWWESPYEYSKFCNINTQKKTNTLCGNFYHTLW